jgi:hypothetical protein
MSELTLHVDGVKAHFRQLWVHLKNSTTGLSNYRIQIPIELSRVIFDPQDTKPSHQSWKDFISDEIRLLGTMIVETYLKAMCEVAGERAERPNWVLTSVIEVAETSTEILLSGTVERFMRGTLK